jgi:hypothetical protein
MGLDSALVRFRHGSGAAEAFVAARNRSAPKANWVREVGFVEHHNSGHILISGTFVGHYVNFSGHEHADEHEPRLLGDKVRADVPKGGSAILLIGPAADVDAMLAALEGSGGDTLRESLSDEQVDALTASLAASPVASAGPARQGEVAVEASE